MADYKLAVVVRRDLGMSAGKTAAQVGHAVHDAISGCKSRKLMGAWEEDGSMIVVLQVADEPGLRALEAQAQRQGVACHSVEDEGLTEVSEGAATAIAVGPDRADRVDGVTRALRLFRTQEEDELPELRRRLAEAEAELQRWRSGGAAPCAPSPPSGPALAASADAAGAGSPLLALKAGETCLALDLRRWGSREDREPVVPDMCERWCWEGDESILPSKWELARESCFGGGVSGGDDPFRPWEQPTFDRQGVFFITRRSETHGIALALAAGADQGVIRDLGVHPSFRRRGVGRCLLRLCLQRHAELGRQRVLCALDGAQSPAAWQLLTSEGFEPITTGLS